MYVCVWYLQYVLCLVFAVCIVFGIYSMYVYMYLQYVAMCMYLQYACMACIWLYSQLETVDINTPQKVHPEKRSRCKGVNLEKSASHLLH